MHCMCMKMLQLGPKANQLTGFYIRATLALNGLRNTQAIEVQFIKKLDNTEAGLKKKAFSVKKRVLAFFALFLDQIIQEVLWIMVIFLVILGD